MESSVVVALLSLLGTAIGSICGIFVSQKLTNFRLERLEETVKTIATQDQRLYKLEEHNTVQDVQIETLTNEQKRIVGDIKKLSGRNS